MPSTSATIRLFVSSTFSDLKGERDVLQRDVFPRLRRLCLSKGLRFQAIDLRWGVSEEAARDNRTMRICLRELARCQLGRPKPNFLVLLGNRYGWRPLPEVIPVSLFAKLKAHLESTRPEALALLAGAYRVDENAVPPVAELQPRGAEGNWQVDVEQPLLRALEEAARAVGIDPEPDGVAIGVSATEQEILAGALKVPDAASHVLAFFRTIDGLPSPPPGEYVETGEAADRLDSLKRRIGGHLGTEAVCGYHVPWRSAGLQVGDLEEFRELAWKRLSAVVESQLATVTRTAASELERQAHQEFAEERCRHFTGRVTPLERIAAYLGEGPGRLLAVTGPPGSGKSAVMARAVQRSAASRTHGSQPELISRYIGVTAASTDLIQLLRDVVQEIRRRYPTVEPTTAPGSAGAFPGDIPFEYAPLVKALHEALQRPTAGRPLFLFLDSLDQLSPSHKAHSLAWLPRVVGPNVRLVVSAAFATTRPAALAGQGKPGTPAAATGFPVASARRGEAEDVRARVATELASRLEPSDCITLDPLDVADGEEILTAWLADAGRRLQPAQLEKVLASFAIEGNPLWLRAAANEARRLPSWVAGPSLAPTAPGLLLQVLHRLSREEEHGAVLVSRAVSHLACARNGLAEDEMVDVLSADAEVMADLVRRSPTERLRPEAERVRSLPVAVWVRLHGDLAFYLVERRSRDANLIGFYHRSFADAVRASFLPKERMSRARQGELAMYFSRQGDPDGDGSWAGRDARPFSELAFHLAHGEAAERDRLRTLLLDYRWIRARLRATEVTSLIEDYELVPLEDDGPLDAVKGALTLCSHVLRTDVRQLPSQLTGRLLGSQAASVQRLLSQVRLTEKDRWLRPVTASLAAPGGPLLRVLVGHTGDVKAVTVTPDGKRVVSASDDGTLRVWDVETGEPLRQLFRHALPMTSVAVTPDGRRAVAAEEFGPKLLTLWDLETGAELGDLRGHANSVTAVAVTPDGRRAISGSSDGTIKVWDLETRSHVRGLDGHTARVQALTVTRDCRHAISGSSDGAIRVWDLETGNHIREFEVQTAAVTALVVTPDGRRAISAAEDETLKIWDLQAGTLVRELDRHEVEDPPARDAQPVPRDDADVNVPSFAAALAVTPDGKRALCALDGNDLEVWDLDTGKSLGTFVGHTGFVAGVAVTPDGKRAVSASWDRTLMIWDLDAIGPPRRSRGHHDRVESVVATADGRRAVSASRNALKVWDLHTGALRCDLTGHVGGVAAVALLPDGRRAVSAPYDTTLKVWDLESGTPIRYLAGHTGPVRAVAVTSELPGLERAISASDDGTLKIWDLAGGACLRTLRARGEEVKSVAVTADGERAVSASATWLHGTTLQLWELETGTSLCNLAGHSETVSAVVMASDGACAVSLSDETTLGLWDLDAGAQLGELEHHGGPLEVLAVTPDGKRAICASGGEFSERLPLKVWDVGTGGTLRSTEVHVSIRKAVALAPDGRRVISGNALNGLDVWDLATGALLRSLHGHTDLASAVLLTPDGKRAVSGTRDGDLRVWDLETGGLLCSLEGEPFSSNEVAVTPDGRHVISRSSRRTFKVWDLETGTEICELEGHMDSVAAVVVTPDGTRAVTGSIGGELVVWDLGTGRPIHHLEVRDGPVTALAMMPDGKRAVSATGHETLTLWDLEGGRAVRDVAGPPGEVRALELAGDGNRAVFSLKDGTLQVWDLVEGQRLGDLGGRGGQKRKVKLAADGRHAVSASSETNIETWDLKTGRRLRDLRSRTGRVATGVVTPDGRIAMFAFEDGRIESWDLAAGRRVREMKGQASWVNALAVTSDGKRAASVSSDRTLKIWDVESGIALASFTADSDLTCVFVGSNALVLAGGDDGAVHILSLDDGRAGSQAASQRGAAAPFPGATG